MRNVGQGQRHMQLRHRRIRIGRIAGDPARVQRLVQVDQPQPELGEAEQLLAGLGQERQVLASNRAVTGTTPSRLTSRA